MSEHTPLKLEAIENRIICRMPDKRGRRMPHDIITVVGHTGAPDPGGRKGWSSYSEEREANARRIVALWNMAHDLGLSTEAIEAGIVGEMREALRATVAPHDPHGSPQSGCVACDANEKVRAVLSKLEPGR